MECPESKINMTFRNKYLFIIFAAFCVIGTIYQWIRYEKGQDDYGQFLAPTGKTEKIRVSYQPRSCACPDWIIENGERDEKYFYLDPATFDLLTPDLLASRLDSTTLLTLEGEFLKGKGIPSYYDEGNTKQELGNVFRYTNFEITKRK